VGGAADDWGMRTRSVVPVLVALSAGLAAAAAVRRFVGRHRTAAVPAAAPAAAPVAAPAAPVAVGVEAAREAVVLQFTRPTPGRPAVPARCGETGGRTKAGAPCAARATVQGRCHHHRVAA
jgi:hypothetical protein